MFKSIGADSDLLDDREGARDSDLLAAATCISRRSLSTLSIKGRMASIAFERGAERRAGIRMSRGGLVAGADGSRGAGPLGGGVRGSDRGGEARGGEARAGEGVAGEARAGGGLGVGL